MKNILYCRDCFTMDGTAKQQNSKKRIVFRLILDLLIWIAASIVAFYLFLYGRPIERGFFCDDTSLSNPSVTETISTPLLIALGFTVSLLLVITVEILNYLHNRCQQTYQRASALFCAKSYLFFMIGFLIQELFVDAIKNKLGALRPNFFEVCKPQFNKTLCPGYIHEYTCTENNPQEIRISRQSFPSGHSSFSMYIAIYFCMYIENRLHLKSTKLLKIFLQFGLLLVATICGLGRIRDHKHHPSDVFAGYTCTLGISVAIFVHKMLWKKYVKEKNIKESCVNANDKSRDCFCTCVKSSDSDQHSSSSSQSEHFKTIRNNRNSSSTKLMELQNDDNQNILVTSEIHL